MEKYILKYPPNAVQEPMLSEVILSTGTPINILWASVGYEKGTIVISVVGDKKQETKVLNLLKKRGITVEKLESTVVKNKDKCIDCGACTSLCPVEALFMSELTLTVDQEKCVCCNACVEACPTRALSIHNLDEI